MLTLTDKALKRFKKILKDEECESFGIRIFMTDKACCGPSLALDLVEQAADGDMPFEKDGLKVFIEKKAEGMLSAATMDFSDSRGFVVNGRH